MRKTRLYVVGSYHSGPVKIGITDDIDQRIKQLQTGHPYQLRTLMLIPGDGKSEWSAHMQFSKFRLSGEWFQPAIPIMSWVIWEKCRSAEGSGRPEWAARCVKLRQAWQNMVSPSAYVGRTIVWAMDSFSTADFVTAAIGATRGEPIRRQIDEFPDVETSDCLNRAKAKPLSIVDLANAASIEQLEATGLPSPTAQRLIDARARGPFASESDIGKVRCIGRVALATLRGYARGASHLVEQIETRKVARNIIDMGRRSA